MSGVYLSSGNVPQSACGMSESAKPSGAVLKGFAWGTWHQGPIGLQAAGRIPQDIPGPRVLSEIP